MPDILDIEPQNGKSRGRWIMRYEDGRERRSQFRWDLISNPDNTVVTQAARDAWSCFLTKELRCPFPVVGE